MITVALEPSIIYKEEESPSDQDMRSLDEGLTAHNQDFGLSRTHKYVFARHNGVMCGGISGSHTGTKFHIRHLWVEASCRGLGIGKGLLKEAERIALKNGCRQVFVDTMSFQAPDFYQKHGYNETARVHDFYDGYDRIFFEKKLG